MTPPSSADAHSHVARFLEQYGYTSTLDMFRREAGSLIPNNPTLLSNNADSSLVAHLDSLHLDSPENILEVGDLDFYTTLYSKHSTLHNTNILAVSQQPDLIATSSTDKSVKLFQRTLPPTLIHTFQHHQAPVLSIDFHPTQPNLMLTTSMDGTSVLVDINTSEGIIQRFKDHQRYVVRGLFSPHTGQYFATASYDRTVCIYEFKNDQYELVMKRGPYLGNVETIVFTSDHCLFVGVQKDHCLHLINLLQQEGQDKKVNMNMNGDDWVSFSPTWLSLCPGHSNLILVSTDHPSGRLILLDLDGKQIQNYYIAPNSDPTDFTTRRHVFHPSGRYFYVIGGDQHNTIKVVETRTGNLEATLDDGHEAMIRAISFDPWAASGSGAILTAGFDHTLATWSTLSAASTMDDMIR